MPFLRGIVLNGSVAEGRASRKSDIDLLIITRQGRIFTVRLLVLVLACLCGSKRSKDENKPHPGKFCLNQFTTDQYLKSAADAQKPNVAFFSPSGTAAILMLGDSRLFSELKAARAGWEREREINFDQYFKSPVEDLFPTRRTVPGWAGQSLEWFFGRSLGDWVERRARSLQVARINKDERTAKYRDSIVFNDQEMRFHPPKTTKG